MSIRTRFRCMASVLLALLFLGTFLPSATSAQDSGGHIYIPFAGSQVPVDSQTLAISADAVAVSSAQSYWTQDRRAGATPYAPSSAVILPAPTAQTHRDELLGIPGASRSGPPALGSRAAATAAFPAEWAAVAAAEAANAELYSLEDDLIEVASPDGTSGIYTTYAGNYNTQFWTYYPYMATGKLYFTTWYGSDKYCSASVISPNNILVTAAHCLYDTDANRWHDSWLFVPADRNYSRPFGSFSWLVARVLSSWMQAPDYNAGIRYDVGVIRLANNSAGRPVTYYTGWLGRSWNQGYVQNQTEIGYAGNITQVFSRVSHSESYYAAADILAYGSNMGGGASGSPIMRAFHPYRSGAYNFVNAVQSGSNDINRPTRNVAPRFSSNNIVILCNDEGC